MRKCSISLLAIVCTLTLDAQVNHLVISQLYGAGGNTGASYNRDFVELFNPTNSPVSLSGYSIQYTAATGTTWTSRALSGTIASSRYFLIQMTTSGTTGASLPTPDLVVANTDMSGTAGKLALVNSTTTLTGACPVNTSIVDFAGFGTTANCFEGAAPAPAPGSNTNSLLRGNNGCADVGNNASDFSSGSANPRNSTFPANVCPVVYSITTGTVSITPFCVTASSFATGSVSYTSSGNYNGVFSALLSDASGNLASPTAIGSVNVNGTNPSGIINVTIPSGTADGTGYRIRVDASVPSTTGSVSAPFEIVGVTKNPTGLSIGQGQTTANITWTNPASCFSEVLVIVKQGSPITATPSGDGSSYQADPSFNGSGSTFDGGKVVYKGQGTSITVTGLIMGVDYYFKLFARYNTSWSSGLETHISSLGILNHIVISQLYGGGGNSGATFNSDFVELFNPTAIPVSLTGYSLQYASATGNNWSSNKMDLSGIVAPHGYFLIKLATGTIGATLPTPDLTGSINMGASAGKVALVNNTTAFTVNCPSASSFIDLAGYGNSDCSEGGTSAPAMSNSTSLFRCTGGCTDTDNNSSDFSASTPFPRNSSSPVNNCPTVGGPLPIRLSQFTANEESGRVRLHWINETEENISSYIVERSGDSRNYASIGQSEPSGNNNMPASYVYQDLTPLKGNNYYRIRTIEKNGDKVYSSIIRINISSSVTGLNLYPNPTTGNELIIQVSNLPKGNYSINVYNSTGLLVSANAVMHIGGAVTEGISIKHLNKGLYYVRINGAVQLQGRFLVK